MAARSAACGAGAGQLRSLPAQSLGRLGCDRSGWRWSRCLAVGECSTIAGLCEPLIDSVEVEAVRVADDQQPLRGQQAIENRHDPDAGGFIQINQQVSAKEHIEDGFAGEQAWIEDASLEKSSPATKLGIDFESLGVASKVTVTETQNAATEGVAREDAAAGDVEPACADINRINQVPPCVQADLQSAMTME